jgi:hypothetical protein
MYKDVTQLLEKKMCILSSGYIASSPATDEESSFAVHYCAGSWRRKSIFSRVKGKIKRLFNT